MLQCIFGSDVGQRYNVSLANVDQRYNVSLALMLRGATMYRCSNAARRNGDGEWLCVLCDLFPRVVRMTTA